jgi:hypothetical protein
VPHRDAPIGPLVVGGLGLVATGIGAGLWAVGKSAENTAIVECGTGGLTHCNPMAKPDADSSRAQITAGNVVFAVGVVGTVVGAIWLWRWSASPPASGVTAGVTPGGGWLGWRGTL